MAGQFTPPEDAGAGLQACAGPAGAAVAPAGAAGTRCAAAVVARAARASHGGTWCELGRAALACGDQVRVGHLAAVWPTR